MAESGDPGIEVIAVDDGSSDGTVELLESYRDRLDLTVERRPGHGWVGNTNHGLRLARARYATVLHQDDYWLPGRTASLRPHCDGAHALVVHDAQFVDAAGVERGRWRLPLREGALRAPEVVPRLLVQNFLAVPAVAFDREAALAAGGLREALWFTADWDLWVTLATAGTTYRLPGALSAYRVHAGALTVARSADEDLRGQLEEVLERHLAAAAAAGVPVAGAERAARLSVEVNLALVAGLHRRRPPLGRLLRCVVRMRWRDWRRYVTDSRIVDRTAARLRLAGAVRRRRRGV